MLLNRGASLSEVQEVLGHADPSTTKAIYTHHTPQFLRESVAKLRRDAGRAGRRTGSGARAKAWLGPDRVFDDSPGPQEA